MARPTVLVRPGPPDTPQFVDIDCSQLSTVHGNVVFFVGDSNQERLAQNVPIDIAGDAVLSYIVPGGPIRNALADLKECSADGDLPLGSGDVICRGETALGDYMGLRYE